MTDRIICKECGGWMESTDFGETYVCDTCEARITPEEVKRECCNHCVRCSCKRQKTVVDA